MSGKTDSRMREKSIYLSKPSYLTFLFKYEKPFQKLFPTTKFQLRSKAKLDPIILMSDNTQLYTLLKKFHNFNGAIPAENQIFLFK